MDLPLPVGPAMRPWSVETHCRLSQHHGGRGQTGETSGECGTRLPAAEKCGLGLQRSAAFMSPSTGPGGGAGVPTFPSQTSGQAAVLCNDLLRENKQSPGWQLGRKSICPPLQPCFSPWRREHRGGRVYKPAAASPPLQALGPSAHPVRGGRKSFGWHLRLKLKLQNE